MGKGKTEATPSMRRISNSCPEENMTDVLHGPEAAAKEVEHVTWKQRKKVLLRCEGSVVNLLNSLLGSAGRMP